MDTLMWFAGEMQRTKYEKKSRAECMEKLLKKWKCDNIEELVEAGKKGGVKTIFPIKNWNTLKWNPKDLGKRPAIPIDLITYDLEFEKNPVCISLIFQIHLF